MSPPTPVPHPAPALSGADASFAGESAKPGHPTAAAPAAPTSCHAPQGQTFESIVGRLEAIATALEGGDTQLEEALALFEEGVRLSQSGAERLDAAERKLETLLGNGKTAPLDEAQLMATRSNEG